MSGQKNELPSRPIENSYSIPGGVGFAGQYPGDPNEWEALKKIRAILDAGVTVFIDLTASREMTPRGEMIPYDHLLRQEADRRRIEVEYVRLEMPDRWVPDKARMEEIIAALENAQRRGQRVYLHCWGGKGRTGTAVGCYLKGHGKSSAEALQVVQELAHTMPKGRGFRVPENNEQCAFVRDWDSAEP